MTLPNTPLEQLDAQRRARLARPSILTGSAPAEPDETLSLVQRAGDVLAAPFRGVEGAVQDLYGLADTLSFDALPDYEQRVLGESKTGLGGLVEGITNFAVGMAGAEFAPLAWTAKMGRLAPLARTAVKGAIADFAVFDGNEERLSNLIQSFPALQNPVNEFLAASPDDPEIEGRFKNALEGLGLGSAIDLIGLAFKGLRAGRLARAARKDPEAVERAFDRAAPPKELTAATKKASGRGPGLGQPNEAAPPGRASKPDPVSVLKTFDVDEATARQLLDEVGRRQAPFSHATLTARDPLDPRVNPRNLTKVELLEQGMQRTDLNLSRYQGPDGPLNLVRAMEQLVEPLREVGDASRRTLSQQEDRSLQELASMVGENNPRNLIARGQQDLRDLPAMMARLHSYRLAALAQSKYAHDLLIKAGKSSDDKDLLLALQALESSLDLTHIVKGTSGETGRGLGSLRLKTPLLPGLFDREAVEAALHERGGRKKALDIVAKAKTLAMSTDDPIASAARVNAMAEGAFGRRGLGVVTEWWYNSLLGRPTTLVVNGMSQALMTVYRPLRLIAGGALTGKSEVIQDGVRELQNLVHSASDAWQAVHAAARGEGALLDPRTLTSDIVDPTRKAITAANLGVDPDSVHGQALDWFGKAVRLPSATLTATDQLFQQLNYRAVARSEFTKEALQKGIPPEQVAEHVAAGMEQLMRNGQAYGTAQLYHRGVEDAVNSGLRAKIAVDEHAQKFVTERLLDPEHARLSKVGELAHQRAQETGFTTPLTPGTLPYRVQEMVLNHWYMRLVMPFVRTPVNILKEAHEHTAGALAGVVQYAAQKAFPSIAPALESSRNRFLRDMLSGDPRKKADAVGRLAVGMSTTALVLTKAAETDENGFPMITGRGPTDREQRRILEDAGWQPYSIRVGKSYVSYSRLDPIASILGTVADIVNFSKYAATEDQETVEAVTYGTAVALATNLTNKTYLSGLAAALEMLQDPQRRFPYWIRNLAGSFVPGEAAAVVNVLDPHLRDVGSILDAASARTPGLSSDLPPLRNVLGEPVRRARALGDGISSVVDAFVPILYRDVSDDTISKEMARLGAGFTPPKKTRGGLDLTSVKIEGGTNAYDRWLELHGEVKLGGRSLRQSLRRLIDSAGYQRIPPESTVEVASPRISMIQSVIDDYRAAALRQVVREIPALGDAERSRVAQKAALLRGRETRPSAVDQLRRALPGGR